MSSVHALSITNLRSTVSLKFKPSSTCPSESSPSLHTFLLVLQARPMGPLVPRAQPPSCAAGLKSSLSFTSLTFPTPRPIWRGKSEAGEVSIESPRRCCRAISMSMRSYWFDLAEFGRDFLNTDQQWCSLLPSLMGFCPYHQTCFDVGWPVGFAYRTARSWGCM